MFGAAVFSHCFSFQVARSAARTGIEGSPLPCPRAGKIRRSGRRVVFGDERKGQTAIRRS